MSRNRVKRCLRAAWRRLAPGLPGPIDVMIVARPADAPRNARDAEQALGHLLRRYRKSLPTHTDQESAPSDPPQAP